MLKHSSSGVSGIEGGLQDCARRIVESELIGARNALRVLGLLRRRP
jgi:hypothetical protein